MRVPRGVARDRIRAKLLGASRALFDGVGYDGATTAEIAARAGVSQRTLYRYFNCKEDVVLDWLDAYNERVCAGLRGRPGGEPVLLTLRRALDAFCGLSSDEAEQLRWIGRLTAESTALKAGLLTRHAEWEDRIAAELTVKGVPRRRARFLGNFTVGIIDVAFRELSQGGGPDLAVLMDEGFAILGSVQPALAASNDRWSTDGGATDDSRDDDHTRP